MNGRLLAQVPVSVQSASVSDLSPADETPTPSRPYPATEAILWALAGLLLAVFLVATQASALGSVSSLLQVGVESDLAPYISSLLPDIELVPGVGTEGQTYFAIATDLSGEFVPQLIPSPGLRYARIGFPWLASLGGLLTGRTVLDGMLTVTVLSSAAATTAAMGLAAFFGMRRWVALGLFANLGWFLGIRLLTPDPLGMALMLGGLLAAVHNRSRTATALFVAAALTKEPYYAAALAVAIWLWQRRFRLRALVIALTPMVGVMISSAIVNQRIGTFADAPNVSWPVVGIVKASAIWADAPAKDQFYSGLALAGIGFAILAGFVTKSDLIRWCAWGWAAIGLLGSDWIWFFGNSTARVLAPTFLFGAMGFGSARPTPPKDRSKVLDPGVDSGRGSDAIRQA